MRYNYSLIEVSAFSVFDAFSVRKEYLYTVLRSIVGKLQMERPTTGTSYPTINDKDVASINIPILSDSIQEKIVCLVQQSFSARKKARDLLEKAISKVEEIVDQSKIAA
jgi:restriction endonuclease S subunit